MDHHRLQPSRQLRPFPKFNRPVMNGFFSVDSDRKYQDSICNLKYLKIPSRVDFNLNLGDSTYVDKPESAQDEQLTHILTYLMRHKAMMVSNQTIPDFVCFRGLLKMLMSTPYEDREPWIVLATKFKNTIYLCAQETQQKKSEKQRRTARDIKFMRYGFKFESFLLTKHPSEPPPGSSKPIIEAEEFCAMFSTELDGKKILYGAEMDGVIASQPCRSLEDLRKVPQVEVKVKRRETTERQVSNFHRYKSRNWYFQSFLVGIDTIHVGLRDDDGFVDEVRRVSLKELSDEAKKNDFWHATVAMNFLNDFLKMVSRDMKQIDNPDIVHRYQYDPARSEFVTCNQLVGRQHAFLTRDFVASMNSL